MLHIAKYIFFLFLSLFFIVSCKRVDDEPIAPIVPITRLYVSFSDIYVDDGTSEVYNNIVAIDPADSIIDGAIRGTVLGYNSQTTNGNGRGVVFNADISRLFQAGSRDKYIRSFTLSNAGVISASTYFVDTLVTNGIRDIALYSYLNSSNTRVNQLYVADLNGRYVHFYLGPQSLTNYIRPTKRFYTGANSTPFGLDTSNDTLFVSMSGNAHEIRLYAGLNSSIGGEDTTVTPEILSSITIAGATDLRGLSYSDSLDILAVADNDGKVFIIEDAKSKFSAGGEVNPTRTITGFSNPADVAIDERSAKKRLYVADRTAHSILLFDITTANGNATPLGTLTFGAGIARTPEFIHLDAR